MVQQIADNIYVITENLGSNNTAIVTPGGVVLMDTPHKPTDALKWRSFVSTLGPLKYLIISDHHIDHTLTNAFFGGTMIGHQGAYEFLANTPPTKDFIVDLLGTLDPQGRRLIEGDFKYRTPDIAISNDITLYLGDMELRLIHRRGHTKNNIMLYLPQQKILCSGDNVCENGLPSSQECCLFDLYETLDFIINELDVETIVPGHGEVCTKKEARRFKGQIEEYAGRIKARIDAGDTKEQIIDTVRYEDYIHCDMPHYKGYPAANNEGFQRNSVSRIYDWLTGQIKQL